MTLSYNSERIRPGGVKKEENHPAFTRGKEVRRVHCHGLCYKPANIPIGATPTCFTDGVRRRVNSELTAEQDFKQDRPLG